MCFGAQFIKLNKRNAIFCLFYSCVEPKCLERVERRKNEMLSVISRVIVVNLIICIVPKSHVHMAFTKRPSAFMLIPFAFIGSIHSHIFHYIPLTISLRYVRGTICSCIRIKQEQGAQYTRHILQ